MKSSTWFRLVLFPLLLPLSILYGIAALVKKRFSSLNQVVLGVPVFSIGNFTVGGTGKTPLVALLVDILVDLEKEPVLISKSYKGSLKIPSEVFTDSDVKSVGDEALLLKTKFPNIRVFSGPHKTKTALFASSKIVDRYKAVFIIDDGAQHHGLYKDFKVHVWDMSLHKTEMFPFPLGRAREFWFLGEKPDLTVLNRSQSPDRNIQSDVPKVLRAHYEVVSITGADNDVLSRDFTLISGLGNFFQLERGVDKYCTDKSFRRVESLEGRDHDSFDWFRARPELTYVCTEKDHAKLKTRINKDKLFVVKSEFTNNFKLGLTKAVHNFFNKGET